MANLYVTVKLQGLGWKDKHPRGEPTEEDYRDLCAAIGELVLNDSQFTGGFRTASIQIRGYDPVIKTMTVGNGDKPDREALKRSLI